MEEACAEVETLVEAEAEEELSELGFSVAQALRTKADTATVPMTPKRRDWAGCLENADIGSLLSGWSENDYIPEDNTSRRGEAPKG